MKGKGQYRHGGTERALRTAGALDYKLSKSSDLGVSPFDFYQFLLVHIEMHSTESCQTYCFCPTMKGGAKLAHGKSMGLWVHPLRLSGGGWGEDPGISVFPITVCDSDTRVLQFL